MFRHVDSECPQETTKEGLVSQFPALEHYQHSHKLTFQQTWLPKNIRFALTMKEMHYSFWFLLTSPYREMVKYQKDFSKKSIEKKTKKGT